MLSALGIVLHVVESFVPLPVPFLKIGLANVASVIALMVLSPRDMLIVMLTRVVAGSLLIGSLLSPGFIIGLISGLAAVGAMWVASRGGSRLFSVIGISLVGSVTHVLVQLVLVMLLFVRDPSLFLLLPVLLTTALVGGLVVGMVSLKLIPVMRTS
ncbi:MAG: Gx transporter family protein [Ignavibacteria bacterium]|nr:Gx transporter family protein [Ignavibacteria bacterium]